MSDTTTQKQVGRRWKWFTDYAYASAEWTLNAPADRELEVGMGIKAFGKPRGERRRFTGHVSFTTIGIGAIHVRVVDTHGPCLVQLDQGDVGAIPIYPLPEIPSVTKPSLP